MRKRGPPTQHRLWCGEVKRVTVDRKQKWKFRTNARTECKVIPAPVKVPAVEERCTRIVPDQVVRRRTRKKRQDMGEKIEQSCAEHLECWDGLALSVGGLLARGTA